MNSSTIIVLVVLLLLLTGAVWLIMALLKRLDEGNMAYKQAADTMLQQAMALQKTTPKQLEAVLESLSKATAGMYASIKDTVGVVMAPPPIYVDQTTGQPVQQPYTMPTIAGDGQDAAIWDHTDKLAPYSNGQPHGDVGYEFENEPGFDPDNVFGIPNMKSRA